MCGKVGFQVYCYATFGLKFDHHQPIWLDKSFPKNKLISTVLFIYVWSTVQAIFYMSRGNSNTQFNIFKIEFHGMSFDEQKVYTDTFYRQIDDFFFFKEMKTHNLKQLRKKITTIGVRIRWRWTNLRQTIVCQMWMLQSDSHKFIQQSTFITIVIDGGSESTYLYEQWIWLLFWHIEKFCKRGEREWDRERKTKQTSETFKVKINGSNNK